MADNTGTTSDDTTEGQVSGDSDGAETLGRGIDTVETESSSGDEGAGSIDSEGLTEE